MELNRQNFFIIDTGFFVALGNKSDQNYKKATALLKALPQKKWITTWPVFTETCHLLSKISYNLLILFLKNYEDKAFEVFDLTHEHARKLTVLMQQYRELPMDLADASLVILAEHLGHGTIISTDMRDFKIYKWKNHKPFQNLFNDHL
jgi:uncharacterized protein